jgi:hypothetical protein
MDKNKVIAAVISIAIGMLIGSILVQYVMTSQEQCTIIKQENKMLMDMIMRQQENIIIQDSAIPDSIQWYEQ